MEAIINLPMEYSIFENLNTDPSRDANNWQSNTDLSDHIHDLSGQRCEHPIKASILGDVKAVHLLLPVTILSRCTLVYQASMEDKPASVLHRVEHEEVTSTRSGLNPELSANDSKTGQICAVFQPNWLDAFGDCNLHGRAHLRTQKKKALTSHMRKLRYS